MIRELINSENPVLYRTSEEIKPEELPEVNEWVTDLHDTLMEYRSRTGAGRAIAAPQIGIRKCLIYMNINEPVVFINPQLIFPDDEVYIVLDDCLTFPGLMVKVKRYKRVIVKYFDLDFMPHEQCFEGDLSELLQHEYDHLNGILMVLRAVDNRSMIWEQMKRDF